jgi:type VI secretion system protein ImpF
MATSPDARDRLQPALLDRLTGDAGAADDSPFITKAALRQAVLRDLGWLFNAVQPLAAAKSLRHPQAARSVLNFGLPPLAGQVASKLDVTQLERVIRQAIIDFEPRVRGDTVTVRALEAEDVLGTHNVIEFEIRGWLWAQPVPLEMMLRTHLDLEAGKVELRDLSPGAAVRAQATEAP